MSKQLKKKAKKGKKVIAGVLPVWCNCANLCCVGLLALIIGAGYFGGLFTLPGDNGLDDTDDDDDDNDTTTTPPVTHQPDVLYKLSIQIYTWTSEPGYSPEDMIFEIWKLSTYTGVGSGEFWGDLHLSMWGSPWTYSSESEHFTYGTAVAIDMFITPNNHGLTLGDWLSTYVGAPQSTYAIYQNGIHCLDILLKWVVV